MNLDMAIKRQARPKRKPTTAPGRPRTPRSPKKGSSRLKGSFIGLRIDDDLKTRLELLGDQEGKSTSDMLKDLIEKHVETKEALDMDLDDDQEDDSPKGNFDAATGKPVVRGTRKKSTGKQVSFETLLDDLLRYQGRLKELNGLLETEQENAGWFGTVPPYLKVAKTVCEKKLKLITDQMKALFPDMPVADAEDDDSFLV